MTNATATTLAQISQYVQRAQFDQLINLCKETLLKARARHDRSLESTALYGLSLGHLYLGKFRDARLLDDGALQYAREANDEIALAWALTLSGHIHMTATYQSYEANDDYRAALRLAHAQDAPIITIEALTGIANFLLSIGEHSRAQRYAREAFEIAREQDYQAGMVNALCVLGNVLHAEKKVEPALKAFRDALMICETLGLRLHEGLVLGNIGMIEVTSEGHYDEGMHKLEQSLHMAQDIRCAPHEFMALYWLGVAQVQHGKLDAAHDYYDKMLQRAQTWKSREYEGSAFFNLGTLYLVDGRFEDAADSYHHAAAIARETKNPFYEARAEQAIGVAKSAERDYRTALEHYGNAREIYIALDNDRQAADLMRAIVFTHIARIVDDMLRFLGVRKDDDATQDDTGDPS